MKKVSVWVIIVWIVPVLVTIYLFILSDKKMQPVYAEVNSPSLIFDNSNSSAKIKLLINDSLETTNNVYVTTLVFWNKGKLQIKKEDVRQNFYINSSDSISRILDFKVLREQGPINNNFKITQNKNILNIDWSYLDPGNGFKIQLIYTGTNQTKIKVNGSVLGSEVKETKYKPKVQQSDKKLGYFGLGVMTLFVIALWIAELFFKSIVTNRGSLITFTIMFIIYVISLFIFGNDFFVGISAPF